MNVIRRALGVLRLPDLSVDANCHAIGIYISSRGICGKTLREKVDKPAPFPYEKKNFYPYIHGLYDDCRDRFDENSAIICVEGMPHAGKSKLAAGLAEELDMKYYPAVSMDEIYKQPNGDDIRNYRDVLPGNVYPWDVNDFLKDPKNKHNGRLQVEIYKLRFMQYANAVTHLLSTGQGVILEQNPYSDVAFTEAMIECGYISKQVEEWYKIMILSTHCEILHPHLIVYLDSPVNEIEKRIKEKHGQIPPALATKFLETLNNRYKYGYLPEISQHSEMLVYDWTEMGDEEVVVEDIERINFDRQLDPDNQLFKDWRKLEFRHQWNDIRYRLGT
ncbi:NADH dehydrogenase [ubiquinone] 1 alpha subcomplex subunit 10, mitochondrial-like isoform X2 [Artemia franciscana]